MHGELLLGTGLARKGLVGSLHGARGELGRWTILMGKEMDW